MRGERDGKDGSSQIPLSRTTSSCTLSVLLPPDPVWRREFCKVRGNILSAETRLEQGKCEIIVNVTRTRKPVFHPRRNRHKGIS